MPNLGKITKYHVPLKMKIKLIVIGKTDQNYMNEGIGEYISRLKHYVPTEIVVIPSLKNMGNLTVEQIKQKETELLLKQIFPSDMVILLDENGKHYTSTEFASFMQQQMNKGIQNLIFIVGGAYGFSKEMYLKFPIKIALSKMTFSHQMVRLFFVEQVYRAMTILRNESYHHE